MKFSCDCGHIITDSTDFLSYKAHLIADQDLFDLLDEIDSAIEESGPTSKNKEDALMKVRSLFNDLRRTVYQCMNCGNVFFEDDSSRLVMFRSDKDPENKQMLRSAKGDNWQGVLYGDWIDVLPEWREVKGYMSASVLSRASSYDDWLSLESDYYSLFNELKGKGILRSSLLRKNNKLIHSWNLTKDE
ncbi:hypothetical protein AB4Z30_05670 [Paenibacillus sp. 2TAF8]|uniref:hypothetical protein n=1 Tax=Paenibacillus sp. 2TAF8 TaxID=3233020 RepID=UPI003F9B1B17